MINPHNEKTEQPMHLRMPNAEDADDQECRRRSGRRRQEGLNSSFGPVLDLSPGGMRVLSPRRMRGRRNVKIVSCEGTVVVDVRICWSRRVGFRRHFVGMQFQDLTEEQQRQLQVISSAHALTQRLAA